VIYMKHPELGNAHFPDAEQKKLEGEGWVRWPRTPEQKSAAPQAKPESSAVSLGTPAPVGAAPSTVEEARARLDALGIAYSPRAGLANLLAKLEAA
jgi:hypothetical protein